MKKFRKYILLSLVLFLISIMSVCAMETKTNLKTLGDMVQESDGSTSFYIIGKYVFTANYIRENSLSLQDIMLAARSIDLSGGDGETNKTEAYNKMSIQSVSAVQDITGAITGWEFESNLVGKTTLDETAILDVKYIGYEETNEVFTVTFKDEDNSEIEIQYVINQKYASSPKLKEKKGYDFKGWLKCTTDDCEATTEEFDLESTKITSNITLKAKWEKHKYTVTFDKDNNEEKINEKVEYENHLSRPQPDPTKEGYNFVGWFKCNDANCETTALEQFKFEDTLITEDITLKAKWEIKKFTVSFDKNQATSDDIENQTIEYDKTASEPTPKPTRDGYKFLGWFKCATPDSCDNIESEQTAFDFGTKIKENTKLQAKWEKITYTVTFKGMIDDTADDRFVQDKKTITVEYPYNITKDQMPITEQEGYNFINWYDSENHVITLDTESYYVNKDTEITGKWETKKLTILFKNFDKTNYRAFGVDYNKSIPDGSYDALDRESKVEYNSYKFLGWFKCTVSNNCDNIESEQTPFDFEKDGQNVKEDMTFVAKYDQIVNTTEIMSDFTEKLKSDDFSAFISDNNITFNVLKPDANLQTNFDNFVNKIKNIIKVTNVKNVTISYSGEDHILENPETDLETMIKKLSGNKTSLGDAHFSDLQNKTFNIKLTLETNCYSNNGNNEESYEVTFKTENFVYINGEKDLLDNLTSDKELVITDSFNITKKITIDHNLTIDGKGQTLTSTITGEKYTFDIISGNVTIKDLTLKIDTLLPSEYDKKEQKSKNETIKNTIGFKVGTDANLMITNVIVNGSKTINQDELTIVGESMPVPENYSSTNVVINENAAIELEGTLSGSGLTYTSEIYGSPAVLAKENAKMNLGKMNRQTYIFNIKERKDSTTEAYDDYDRVTKFVHYYGNYDNSYATTVLYIYGRNMMPFFYLYNEKLIEPVAFKENGNYNIDKDGKKFTGWRINSQPVTSEDLINKKIENGNGINVVAQYNK